MKHVTVEVRITGVGPLTPVPGLSQGWYASCGDGGVVFKELELADAVGKAVADYVAKQGFAELLEEAKREAD